MIEAIASTRDDIEAAQQHRLAVETAPLPKSDLKAKVRTYVQALVQRGRPKFSVGRGEFKIAFQDEHAFGPASTQSMVAVMAWGSADMQDLPSRAVDHINTLAIGRIKPSPRAGK